jgi:hypothetical protein
MGDTRRRSAQPLFRDVVRADLGRLSTAFSRPGGEASFAFRFLSTLLDEKRGRGTYRMRILYCPPAGLLRRSEPAPQSGSDPAGDLHALWRREVWRERGPWARLRLLAALIFVWPVVVLGTGVWFTAINGSAIRRLTGKGRFRQLGEQLALAATADVLPPWYYIFELWDEQNRARAGAYLHRFETKGGLFRLVKRRRVLPGQDAPLAHKLQFAERCRERGVRTAPVLLAADRGKLLPGFGEWPDGAQQALAGDLFVKPVQGNGGLGTERWWRGAGGQHRSDAGVSLDPAGLLAHVLQLSRSEPCLVQPRLTNHPELLDLCNGALSTVRLMTVEDEHGGYEVTHAVLRMALVKGKTVDNFHAGGIAAAVDLRTGELTGATDIGLRPDVGWCDVHPATGAKIRARRLPFWPETLELARRAHAAFPKLRVIGWDVAILADGPLLIEGNGASDVDILERCYRLPLGDSRFGELMAFHARRATAEREALPGRTPEALL